MKVALAFDYILVRGGMERTVVTLAKTFNADVWTTTYFPEKTYPELKKLRIFSHPLKFYPMSGAMHTEAAFKFKKMDLSDYDFIITSGNWGRYVSLKEGNHPQIHYENTPPRVFYDLYQRMKDELPFVRRQIFKLWVWFMRGLDQKATRKIDKIVCNSENVRKRIKKYYGGDAGIVGVPIKIQRFRYRKPEDYFLSVQRIEPEKLVDLQIEIFRKLPCKLIVVGEGRSERGVRYFKKIKEMAPENVVFAGSVSDEELVDLYSRCKAAIQTAMDEDFGEIPVEAMASGKPCIAVNEGGFRETIVHGKTGLLVDQPHAKNFVKVIKNFVKYDFDPKVCRRRAKLFSEEAFVERFKSAVTELLERRS